MDERDLNTARDYAIAYARANACDLAIELLEWQETTVLRDGKVRELANALKALDAKHSLVLARSFAERAALELAARCTTPDREAWQPIETAPRDGTPIIGCTFHPQLMHLYAPCTIFWATYHPNSEGEKTWRTSAICGNKMKGVTHWMPLPAAPASDKGGA